ncbi:unnamed protein product, partial [Choristocarpus tenellus]
MINPGAAQSLSNPHAGTLTLSVSVDKTPLRGTCDPGSKAWLLAHALDHGVGRACGGKGSVPGCGGVSGAGDGDIDGGEGGQEDEVLPEDKFHLKLAEGVNTGGGGGGG